MADGDIQLKMNVDIKDAQSAISTFEKTTQKAFSSSDKSIQSFGNQLNKATQNIQNLLAKMSALATKKIPTEQYTALQEKIKGVTKEYESAKKALAKLGKEREYTPRFQAATDEVNKYRKQLEKAQLTLAKLQNQGVPVTAQPYRDALKEVANYTRQLKGAESVQQQLINQGLQYKQSDAYDEQAKKVKRYENNLTMLQNKMKIMQQTGMDYTTGDKTPQYARMQQQLTNSVNQAILLNNKINQTFDKLNESADEATDLDKNIRGAANSASQLQLNINWANTIINSLSAGFRSARTAVTTLFRTMRTLASTALRAVSRITSHISGPFKNSVSSAGKSHNFTFKKMLTTVLKYGFGIRSIFLLYKKVRTTISTGLTEMAKQFEDVAADVDNIKNSWSGFKASLVSAFQPIFSYVVPALSTLINYLTSAMNAIANFFAVLTGQGYYYKAKKGNESVAKSIGATGDAADDANEKLAEYDELLVIDQDSSSGGGSGGSGSSDSDAWNWEKVETTASNWAELLKKAFTTWDFTQVGDILSKKLTAALNKIEWGDVYATLSNWGKGLATFLNGLISDDLFSALGKTIANSLNAAMKFLNSFATWFKWKNVGNSIATGINSFIENADFKFSVATANKWINGILDMLITAVSGVHWTQLSNKIAEAIGEVDASGFGSRLGKLVNSIVNAIYSLVSNKSTWINLGTKIGEGINAFFTETEWEKLGATIGNTFRGIITAITTALEKVDWEEVGKSIKEFIEGIDFEQLKFSLEGLKDALKEAFIALLEGLEIDPDDVKHEIVITLARIALVIGAIASIAFGVGVTQAMLTALIRAAFTQLLTRVGLGTAVGAGTATAGAGGISVGTLSVIADIALWIGAILLMVQIIDMLARAVCGDDNELSLFIKKLKVLVGTVQLEKNGVDLRDGYKEMIDLEGEGKFQYKINELRMKSKEGKSAEKSIQETIQDLLNKALSMTSTSLNINTDMTGDATSIKDLESITTELGEIDSYDTLTSKVNVKFGGGAVTSKSGLSDLTSSFKSLNSEATGNKKATYSVGFGDMLTQITDLDSWRVKFNNLALAWTDTKATMSVNTGGEIQSINDLTGKGGWKEKFTELKNAWTGKEASFTTKFSLGDASGWTQSLKTNVIDKWKSAEATFTTSLSGVVTDLEGFKSLSEGFSKLANFPKGDNKATFNIEFAGESDINRMNAYAEAQRNLWESFQKGGGTATYSVNFSGSATDVSSFANNVLDKIYSALSKSGINVKTKVWAPATATGGVFTAAATRLIGEDGTEAVVPLEKNTGWLRKMATMMTDELLNVSLPLIAKGNVLPVSDAFMSKTTQQSNDVSNLLNTIVALLQNQSDSDSNNQPIVLQLDSRTVAEVVWDESEKRYKQTGRRFAY